MASKSRFYAPEVYSGDLEVKQVLVTLVIRGVKQPKPTKISVQQRVKLGQLKKHLSARGLAGSLYIDRRCYDRADDNEELELQHSTVEIRRKSPLRPNELSEVSVSTFALVGKRRLLFQIKDLKCFHTTKLDDLKFFIQDHCGIPVCLQQFKGIRSDGRETRKMINLSRLKAISFNMYGEGDLLLVVDSNNSHYKVENHVPDEELRSNRHQQLISQEIISNWQGLARLLGLTNTEIDGISQGNSYTNQSFEALRTWHKTKGKHATWRALVCACIENKKKALAEKIVDICKWFMFYSDYAVCLLCYSFFYRQERTQCA